MVYMSYETKLNNLENIPFSLILPMVMLFSPLFSKLLLQSNSHTVYTLHLCVAEQAG